MEKDSNELDKIDPKNWSLSDRQRLTLHWIDLQRKLDEQYVNFIYKPYSSLSSVHNHSYLGELHLKTLNQDNEHLQLARLQRQQIALFDPYDNQDGNYRSNQVSKNTIFSKINFLKTKFSLRCSVDVNQKLKQENVWL